MNDQQKHLSELFANLLDTPNHDDRERLIENEACRHRITRPLDIFLLESICKLAQENAELKRKLYEYENNYRMGKFPTLADLHKANQLDSVRFVTFVDDKEKTK